MNNLRKRLALTVFLLVSAAFAFPAAAQTLSFTSNVQSGSVVVPTLTWSTTPAAQSCTASGDWSGTKAASGTQTLTQITASKTYTLSCTWTGDTTATLSWIAPTTYEDDDNDPTNNPPIPASVALTYRIEQAAGGGSFSTVATGVTALTRAFTGLAPNTYDYRVFTNCAGCTESKPSTVARKVITSAPSAVKSVGITVNPQPTATILSIQ